MLNLEKANKLLGIVFKNNLKIENLFLKIGDEFSCQIDTLGKVITISEKSFYDTDKDWYEFMIKYLKDQFDLDVNTYMFSDFLETFSFLHEIGHYRQGLEINSKYDNEYFLYKNTMYKSYEDAFKAYRELTLEKDADKFAVSFIKRHKFEIWSIMNDISVKDAEEESQFWEATL